MFIIFRFGRFLKKKKKKKKKKKTPSSEPDELSKPRVVNLLSSRDHMKYSVIGHENYRSSLLLSIILSS